jgi:hypothetical protein
VKRTLKLSFIFLGAAALNWLVMAPKAEASLPKHDFFVHVLNSTSHPLEICNISFTSCEEVVPGMENMEAYATEGRAKEFLEEWLAHRVIKACGEIIPLKNLIGPPVMEIDRWGKVTYRLTISEDRYMNECGSK